MERHDDTFYLIARTENAMREWIRLELAQNGVSGMAPSHGAILMVLFEHGTLAMRELSRKIGKTPQTVTVLVKKLAENGYVSLAPDTKDRRSTLVSITQKGRAFKQVIMRASQRLYDAQYAGMQPEQIAQLRRLLGILRENMDRALAERSGL